MGATGCGEWEAKPGGWRQSLWNYVTALHRLKLGRGDIAIILICLVAMWSPIILIARYVGAGAYGGSDVAFWVSMAIGIIGTVALYLKAFADMFGGMKMYEALRKEFDEYRKEGAELRGMFREVLKWNEENRKWNEEYRKEGAEVLEEFQKILKENEELRRVVERLVKMVDGGAGVSGHSAAGRKFTGRGGPPANAPGATDAP